MRNPIIAALDLPSADRAVALATQLAPLVGACKIGAELFTTAGPEVVRRVRALGAPVFLDLKFHDIPNTVARAVEAATRLGVDMLTVHASGGRAMLEAAERAALATARTLGAPPPLVLAVTVLTSLDAAALAEVGWGTGVAQQVERLAQLSRRAGLRGLVCSPLELAGLRALLGPDVVLVTPGIRSAAAPPDDQRRTLTAAEALAAGASWLVVGRPLYAAPDPKAAAQQLLEELPRSRG